MLLNALLGANKVVGKLCLESGAVQNSSKDLRQIVQMATAVNLNLTRMDLTLLQQ